MLPDLFCEKMKTLLGAEYDAFLSSLDRPRAVALRLNPLKCSTPRGSASQGLPALPEKVCEAFHLTPVPWARDGYNYDPAARPGLHPYHAAGVYYLQEASAMAPAGLLDAQPGERVLDLCAAPGGKSTQIAASMDGRGLLVCNEIHPKRAAILSSNIERMGVANALVLNEHPSRIAERFPAYFDRVLVDAPCSGEGMFRKHDAASNDWSFETVSMCAARQAEILDCAARTLRPGGRLVYSTCTFNDMENEGSVLGFLSRHTDFSPEDFKLPGVGPSHSGMLRLFPHRLRGDGHFVAKLRRRGESAPDKAVAGRPDRAVSSYLEILERDVCRLDLIEGMNVFRQGDWLYARPIACPDLEGIRVISPGLCLARLGRNHLEPGHALAMAIEPGCARRPFALDEAAALAWLRGEAVPCDGEKGWTLALHQDMPLGWGKVSDGMLKNHLPKGLRRC